MALDQLDWIIIIAFFIVTLGIGVYASRTAGRSVNDFFLSGRNMPWWLLGVSMVATTFSADTPNFVTQVVREDGVAKNWVWWAFLLTGMATVFIYAKLWRRSGITTDLEFYELRYSGDAARFLRGFRAIYLGVFFNVMIMAGVLLAGMKIAGVMLGWSPKQTVLIVGFITVAYSALGGLRGVILTDFFQFALSMIGMIAAAIYIVNLPEVNGLSNLIQHKNVVNKLNFIPDLTDMNVAIPLFFIPLAVQWWSVWYPGAEPGGGGYVAQRMLSARNERDAIKATLFFNVAHYALRPWPWIIIALASLVVFPELSSIRAAFPSISSDILAHDIAFSAMLTKLPTGLLGLVIAALLAALMSTISTHLNWGASYVVNDVYTRFIDPDAPEKETVFFGRLTTVILMILAGVVALFLTDAMEAFNILLQIGAGTGLLFLLRWFWWRINAYSELTAMIVSFAMACLFKFVFNTPPEEGGLHDWQELVLGVLVTTIAWVGVTLMTRPTDSDVLHRFVAMIRPHQAGWKPVINEMQRQNIVIEKSTSRFTTELLLMFAGCVMVYAALFGTGYVVYGEILFGLLAFFVAALAGLFILKTWRK